MDSHELEMWVLLTRDKLDNTNLELELKPDPTHEVSDGRTYKVPTSKASELPSVKISHALMVIESLK